LQEEASKTEKVVGRVENTPSSPSETVPLEEALCWFGCSRSHYRSVTLNLLTNCGCRGWAFSPIGMNRMACEFF